MKKLQPHLTNRFATGLLGAAACLAAAIQPASAEDAAPKVEAVPAPGGMVVHVDPQTGRVIPAPAPGTPTLQLSPAEQNRLSTSSEGLVEQYIPGVGYKLNVQGRFQSPLMATTGPDGKVRILHMGEQSAGERGGAAGHDHQK